MGGGKSHWGKILADIYSAEFFEGDSVIPQPMLDKVNNFRPVPRDMILDYLVVLISEIDRRASYSSNGLVVSQALYLDEDRLRLYANLRNRGYVVEFVWIKVPFFKNLRQIYSRKNGLRWVFYWLMNKPFFQKPTHYYNKIPNSNY